MATSRRWLLIVLIAGGLTGCEKQAPPPSEPPADAPTETPAPPPGDSGGDAAKVAKGTADPHGAPASEPHAVIQPDPHAGLPNPHAGMMSKPQAPMPDPHAAVGGGAKAKGPQPTETQLDGILFKVPEGWTYTVPPATGMAPKAIFTLPPVEGDAEDVQVRVTHFPTMNVSDEMNLQRWYGMFTQPDGQPTKEVATEERFEANGVSFVLVDIAGTMNSGTTPKPDWRMLAAIVKHDRGPHFVKAVGPAKSVEHWKDSVLAYLKSVQKSGSPE